MKSLKLMIISGALFTFSCVPDIEEVFERIETDNAGHMYIYTAPSVGPELAHMRSISESPEIRKSQVLSQLLNFHTQRTADKINEFRTGGEAMIAIKKPPRPCPPPSSCFGDIEYISYFTVNPHDRLDILVNDKPVKIRILGYDDLTKIRTVRIPGKLKLQAGDVIHLKMQVSYPDAGNEIKNEELDWRIQTSM